MQKDYSSMIVSELRSELALRDLPSYGSKKSLIQRLKDDDRFGYKLLTVPELKARMKIEGVKDLSGNKNDLVSRMKSHLSTKGYNFLPIADLRQICIDKNLPVRELSDSDGPYQGAIDEKAQLIKTLTRPKNINVNPSTSNANSSMYSSVPTDDWDPSATSVIFGGIAGFVLLMLMIFAFVDDEEDYEDTYDSSSSYSSTPCEELRDIWCYSYSLDMCIYTDSGSGRIYTQEAKWYGC